jgi:hypothetical protein
MNWAQRNTPRKITGVADGILSIELICLLKTKLTRKTSKPKKKAALVAYFSKSVTFPIWCLAKNSETNLIITKPIWVKVVDITRNIENKTPKAEYCAGGNVLPMKTLNK